VDIKSIVRVFRYGQLESKANTDPSAKRPPTIKFLAWIAVIGVLVAGFALFWLNGVERSMSASNDGQVLDVTTDAPSVTTTATNSTAPAPSTTGATPGPNSGPTP
jgi:hypothetical protein